MTTPCKYACLGNPVDRGAWWAAVLGAAESDTTEHVRGHVRSSLPVHPTPPPALVSIHLFFTPASLFLLCK